MGPTPPAPRLFPPTSARRGPRPGRPGRRGPAGRPLVAAGLVAFGLLGGPGGALPAVAASPGPRPTPAADAGALAERSVRDAVPSLTTAAAAASAAGTVSSLAPGQTLGPGQQLVTSSGYRLIMQRSGNLIEVSGDRLLWRTGTSHPGSRAVLRANGELIVATPNNKIPWRTRTTGHPRSTLTLTANGDLVLAAASGRWTWQNQASSYRLAPTGRLQPGQAVWSTSGGTRLQMGRDGNLVMSTTVAGALKAIWASGTKGHPGAFAVMRPSGDLWVLVPGKVLWASHTGIPHAVDQLHLSVQNDGNMRLYSPSGSLRWSAGDDYPASLRDHPQDSLVDPWGYYSRECVSFAAWRVLARNGIKVDFAGNAYQWAGWARRHGYVVDRTPTPGSVAWTDAGRLGHVAVVKGTYGDWLVVEEYNYVFRGTYAHRLVRRSDFTAYLHIGS